MSKSVMKIETAPNNRMGEKGDEMYVPRPEGGGKGPPSAAIAREKEKGTPQIGADSYWGG